MRHKMYAKTSKSAKIMTNGNYVTHNTKHTILINKTKFTPYSVLCSSSPRANECMESNFSAEGAKTGLLATHPISATHAYNTYGMVWYEFTQLFESAEMFQFFLGR